MTVRVYIMNNSKEALINNLRSFADDNSYVSRKDIIRESKALGINHPSFLLKDKFKVESGVYNLTEMFSGVQ